MFKCIPTFFFKFIFEEIKKFISKNFTFVIDYTPKRIVKSERAIEKIEMTATFQEGVSGR